LNRTRLFIIFTSILLATRASAAFLPTHGGVEELRTIGCRFAVVRDFSLSFDHTLGVVEARRRVGARLESLRAQFANKIGSSTVTWTGNDADVLVSAFGQPAVGRVSVGDTTLQIHVHLPFLLSPLGGKIEDFLTNTAVETLQR
jgi:hypothetical protein